MSLEPLDEAGRHALDDALGDSPWTVITAHYLRRGFCKAYAEGDPMSLTAAVVQWDPQPDEPAAFGNDAEGIWRVLQQVEGWRVVNVAEAQAAALGAAMERDLGRRVRYYGDEHFILTKPPNDYAHPLVRRLTLEDVGLIEQAPPFLQQGRGFGGPEGLLREGIVAGAVDAGRLVGIVHTGAITQGYADIGVATLEQYRRQGISAAAASLVCREVQETGRTPVWSCGEDNWASLRVAEKVGFTPIGRRVYVIPTSEPAREVDPCSANTDAYPTGVRPPMAPPSFGQVKCSDRRSSPTFPVLPAPRWRGQPVAPGANSYSRRGPRTGCGRE